jgi:hypothetical protein
MEGLTPPERAVFVLLEAFDVPHAETRRAAGSARTASTTAGPIDSMGVGAAARGRPTDPSAYDAAAVTGSAQRRSGDGFTRLTSGASE